MYFFGFRVIIDFGCGLFFFLVRFVERGWGISFVCSCCYDWNFNFSVVCFGKGLFNSG